MMRTLSLFSGIGGFELAATALNCFKVEQFVEIDRESQYVVAQHYPHIPIHDDIRTFHATRGQYDCIWGGFPCTGTSNAGNRTGLAHPESSLWWEMLRIIIECRPTFVIVENPEGLLNRGGREVFTSLTMAGYCCSDPLMLSAKEVGSQHQRNRVFIVAFLQDIAQQRYQHQFPTCGADQVRTIAQEAGHHFPIPLFIRQGDGIALRIPDSLDGMPCKSITIDDFGAKAELKVESKLDTNSLKPLCPDKLTSLSNESNNLPYASVLSISSASDCHGIALSGLAISFGKTLKYLPHKTVTRRTWKDTHKKFIKAFHQNKLIKALDKDLRYGGKQIGWCRLLCAPYKEQLSAMPDGDLAAEGGMCSSVEEFVQQYFKGNNNLEVWVIRFEFIADLEVLDLDRAAVLGVYSDFPSTVDSNYPISSPIKSIHQTPLTVLGVYSDSDKEANNNSSIP